MIKVFSIHPLKKPNLIGALASALCMLHCLATPLLFVVHPHTSGIHESSPSWWSWMDYLFLIISFVAVLRSSQTTSKEGIIPILWLSWLSLVFVLLNEKFGWIPLPESIIYIPTLALIALHLYNQRFCRCGKNCIH